MTAPASSASPPTASAPKSGGSAVRLLVLIGILALAVGMWFYDYSYAGPGSESKYKEIDDMVIAKNAKGVKDGGLVTRQDVAAVVGFQPTYVEQKPDCTIEWYCWWGKIPVLSTWKRYITVLYVGEPRRFSSHYLNQAPPEEDLPGSRHAATADAGGTPAAEPGTGEGAGAGSSDPTKVQVIPIGGGKTAEDKPASEEKHAAEKPAAEQPGSKPAEDKPAEKPATEEGSTTKPE